MSNAASTPAQPESHHQREFNDAEDSIDLRDLFARLGRGLPQIIGLALIGLVVASLISLVLSRVQPVSTGARVVFSFSGFERGEYPDKSKFQADDLRAPAVVAEAIRRQGLDTSSEFQSKIRGALSIEGIVPDVVVKARDRLRASGQTPPTYIPDEYSIALVLNRSFPLSREQREHLVIEIVNVARENFRRTYGQLPVAFGAAFETLKGADLPEYEIVFNTELSNLTTYLTEQADKAKSFRSPSTNLSFRDLLEQLDLFGRIQLNEVLGVIHENGLAENRQTALLKMGYYLRQLEYQEKHALEDERLVRDLLAQAQSREQGYVLGVKSQAPAAGRGDTPVLDQGLIDSLMVNDAYNFLVRRALDAGLKVKQVQADKVRLVELRDNLKSFAQSGSAERSLGMQQIQKSLTALETTYNRLVSNVRKTHADFAEQEYGHAIQLSTQVRTEGVLRPLAVAGLVGGFLGFALAAGLSLLGIYVGGKRHVAG